ncbi:MAG: hypothetical protein ACRDQZ_03140 [Mycobacteriales bacterium]
MTLDSTAPDPATPHSNAAAADTYACGGCGACVQFAPGNGVLRCPYCGFQQPIATGDRQVHEHAIDELTTLPRKPVGSIGAYVCVCGRCAATTQTNGPAGLCQFCGAPLVVDPETTGQIIPEAVLPFALDRGGVRMALRAWTSSRWFAPSQLKKVTETESSNGTYLPHWTYDAQTASSYSGERGEYYYETQSYTDNNGNRQTRQVRRTAWYPVSGTVARAFDDVLVPASYAVPQEKLDQLAPWPLPEVVPYQAQYLAGYSALRYDVEPEAGLQEAKSRMADVIVEDCRADIGGDEQRVEQVNTNHAAIMFKLMLLPVWIACYIYAGKTWRVYINDRTGEVIGERPYSKAKIALAVLGGLAIAVIVAWLVLLRRR